MKRVILGFILATFALIHSVGAASSWLIADKLMNTVVLVEHEEGTCTGFVIDSQKHYVLTAAHCDGKDILADHSPAKVVSKDTKADLLVLSVKDIDKPALKLAAGDAAIGEEVASAGFGYGLERPMFRVGHVADNAAQIPELPGTWLLLDVSLVPGQSGGPIVNHDGEVVSIVQMTSDRVGFGRGVDVLRNKVGKYFAH